MMTDEQKKRSEYIQALAHKAGLTVTDASKILDKLSNERRAEMDSLSQKYQEKLKNSDKENLKTMAFIGAAGLAGIAAIVTATGGAALPAAMLATQLAAVGKRVYDSLSKDAMGDRVQQNEYWKGSMLNNPSELLEWDKTRSKGMFASISNFFKEMNGNFDSDASLMKQSAQRLAQRA